MKMLDPTHLVSLKVCKSCIHLFENCTSTLLFHLPENALTQKLRYGVSAEVAGVIRDAIFGILCGSTPVFLHCGPLVPLSWMFAPAHLLQIQE